MNIETRKIGNDYIEFKVSIDQMTITQTLNDDEANSIAIDLLSAAYDLLNDDGDNPLRKAIIAQLME